MKTLQLLTEVAADLLKYHHIQIKQKWSTNRRLRDEVALNPCGCAVPARSVLIGTRPARLPAGPAARGGLSVALIARIDDVAVRGRDEMGGGGQG